MPEISNQTLVVVIQTLASEIRALRQATGDGDAQAEDYQLLEDHLRAADDLERAYDVAAQKVINLPPYRQLVGE